MNCPKCAASKLVNARPKGTDLILDYCPSCHGLFLEKGELGVFIKDERALKRFHAHGLEHMVKSKHSCPKCTDVPLFAGQLPGFHDEVDHCARCGGFWFDHGELTRLIAQKTGGIVEAGQVQAPVLAPAKLQSGVLNPIPTPQWFSNVADSDEVFYWAGSPHKVPFLASGLPILIFGCIWGLFDLFFLIAGKVPSRSGQVSMTGLPLYFFLMLHSLPFWCAILNMFRLILVHGNTHYAVTNKRLMMRSGFWGTDFRSVDFDKVSDLSVNVGPIESMYNCGTVMPFAGRDEMEHNGRSNNNLAKWVTPTSSAFVAVAEPYDVFRLIKELSVNVKTDWQYPNAYRPAENPGYKTKIKRSG